MTRVSVVGLGKLGACMAAVFAAKGHPVVGVDASEAVVEAVNAGRAPVVEPGLDEWLARARPRLRATTDVAEAIAGSDVTFVVVPTPSGADGRFSLAAVRAAVHDLGWALRAKTDYHVVAITSTVLPGALEFGVQPVLEAAAGKRCGRDLGFCYNPEFIALGSVIADFLRPDLVLIGESDPRAGDVLAALYGAVCENAPEVVRLGVPSAELAKVALNAFVTTKISFANMLAELCEVVPGADVDQVCRALGRDTRIGARALRGGLGYGGPCFPRDSVALAALARSLGRTAPIAEATDRINDAVVERVVAAIAARVPRAGCVGVLGVAYKPGTVIVERSHALAVARRLVTEGRRVVLHDRLARPATEAELGDAVAWADSPERCIEVADLVVLAAQDETLLTATTRALAGRTRPLVVVDCWRQLAAAALPAAVTYLPLGVGLASPANVARLEALWAEG